ncbi:hypothetical protein HK103_001210 [Boothiomyces macroporosus]|uniref:ARMC9 CTLH-like domain-containing protein n=1 Tax=Boothiomyces macroporosus TaxID=261099 RepID=A0AAD5UKN0_9FUNG|nr:hypothetical protein HK103_001210 [Boothiomyces macroporosus]
MIGGDWAGQPDYLQYYALPYLPDPTSHPSFKDLFAPEWKSILLSNLTGFINGLLPTTTPALVTLIRNKDLKETPQTKVIVDHQKEEMLEGKLQDLRVIDTKIDGLSTIDFCCFRASVNANRRY